MNYHVSTDIRATFGLPPPRSAILHYNWTASLTLDISCTHDGACSKASGLMPARLYNGSTPAT